MTALCYQEIMGVTPLCSEAGQGKVMWHQYQVIPLRALNSRPRGREDVLFSIDLATLPKSTDILTTICEPTVSIPLLRPQPGGISGPIGISLATAAKCSF